MAKILLELHSTCEKKNMGLPISSILRNNNRFDPYKPDKRNSSNVPQGYDAFLNTMRFINQWNRDAQYDQLKFTIHVEVVQIPPRIENE